MNTILKCAQLLQLTSFFIERGKKEEKNGSSNFFYCNGKFCAKSANYWTKKRMQ